MRLLISFVALFASVMLVQLGSGTLGPLDVLSGQALGFSERQIGLMGSAHFVGFFVGCWFTPRMIGRVGHARAFAAMAATGAMGVLLHPVLPDPLYWAGLRVLTGAAVAGAYTVIEGWLQAKLDRSNRGRVLGIYRVVDLVGQIASQGLIAFLEPGAYLSYNIVAVFCCLCVLPLTLSVAPPPPTPVAPRLRIVKAALLSPLATAGVIVSGLTSASFRMVGPLYGAEVGLDARGIAAFLGAGIVGGAVAQIPVGWLADKIDRRFCLIVLSVGCAAVCLSGLVSDAPILASFLFGLTAFPIFSLSGAHANDFAEADFVVELNAALLFFFALGAIVSPLLAAELVSVYGARALFLYIGAAHAGLIAFTLWRMSRRSSMAIGTRTAYRYLPRTALSLSRLRGHRDTDT